MKNKITKLSKFLRILMQVFFWFFLISSVVNILTFSIMVIFSPENFVKVLSMPSSYMMPLSILITSILVYALYNLIKLLKNYEMKNYFADENIIFFRKFGVSFVISQFAGVFIAAAEIYKAPSVGVPEYFKESIISYKYTLLVQSISHFLMISLVILLVTLLSWIISEAVKINKENSYTI